jgi:hypothetical protein
LSCHSPSRSHPTARCVYFVCVFVSLYVCLCAMSDLIEVRSGVGRAPQLLAAPALLTRVKIYLLLVLFDCEPVLTIFDVCGAIVVRPRTHFMCATPACRLSCSVPLRGCMRRGGARTPSSRTGSPHSRRRSPRSLVRRCPPALCAEGGFRVGLPWICCGFCRVIDRFSRNAHERCAVSRACRRAREGGGCACRHRGACCGTARGLRRTAPRDAAARALRRPWACVPGVDIVVTGDRCLARCARAVVRRGRGRAVHDGGLGGAARCPPDALPRRLALGEHDVHR